MMVSMMVSMTAISAVNDGDSEREDEDNV